MTGLGSLAVLIPVGGLWLTRKPGRLEGSPRALRFLVWMIALPFVANLAGWVFPRWAASRGSSRGCCGRAPPP